MDRPLLYILTIDTLLNTWKYLEYLYIFYRFLLEFILFKEFFRVTLSSLGIVKNYLATI